jgi:hypothetical protein
MVIDSRRLPAGLCGGQKEQCVANDPRATGNGE